MKYGTSVKLRLLGGIACVTSTVALGQTNDGLDEIVVTAQKREQSVDSVGMTITAVTSNKLNELGVNSVADLAKIEPSFVVSLNEEGEPFYQIRGIGFNSDSVAAPPAVTVYVDEIAYPYASQTKGANLDVERVEILKGPQGTLFGQNATGGAINYIAAKPTDQFEFGVDADYGRFNATTLGGFVSGPITDTLKARLAFSIDEGGAWQHSLTHEGIIGNKDNQFARLLLEWNPEDNLKMSVNLNGWEDHSDRQAPQNSAVALLQPAFASYVPLTVNAPIAPHDSTVADWAPAFPPENHESFYQGSLRLDYRVSDAVNFTYLGTYEHTNLDDAQSFVGTSTYWTASQIAALHTTSHELRASGKILDDKLDWLIGGNYSDDNDNESSPENVSGASTAYVLTGIPGGGPIVDIDPTMTQVTKTKSAFGNLEYHVLDNLSTHAGIRYTASDIDHTGCMRANDAQTAQTFTAFQDLFRFLSGLPALPAIPAGGCATFSSTFAPTLSVNSLDQHNVPWRVGVDWTPLDKTLLYGTISKGYKAGSYPNIGAVSTRALEPATQESVLAYEVGVKSRLDDGRLQVNGAVFYYNYKDKQEELRVPDPVFGLLNTLLNVPKSEEKGVELAVNYRPVESLTLSGSATYLDSDVTSDFFNFGQFAVTAADATNFKGNRLPDTPKWTIDAGARYDWAVSASYGAFVGGDEKYVSSTQSYFAAYSEAAAGFPSMVNASYALLNLRAGLDSNDGRWRFEAYGENVTNRYYTLQATRLDTVARYTGAPATWGIRARYRYK